VRISNSLLSAAACLGIAAFTPTFARADVMYSITVNTSSQSGETGFIDIQLNPGDNTSQAVTLAITGYSGGTLQPTLTPPTGAPFGDVTGTLPGSLLLDNGQTTNEFTEGIAFGNSISFLAAFSGPALDSPDGSSGSLFQVDFLNANGSAFLFTADPEGNNPFDFNVATIAINSDGSTTPTTYPDANGNLDGTVTATPEPSPLLTLGGVLAGLCWSVFRRARAPKPGPKIS